MTPCLALLVNESLVLLELRRLVRIKRGLRAWGKQPHDLVALRPSQPRGPVAAAASDGAIVARFAAVGVVVVVRRLGGFDSTEKF